MSILRTKTDPRWAAVATGDLDRTLSDHAHCEKKAAATAMKLVADHPTRPDLVRKLARLAQEEQQHFLAVLVELGRRGAPLLPDEGDPYAQELLRLVRSGPGRLVDRLLVGALIEARSCERLELLGQALAPGPLRDLYLRLAAAEAGHERLFVELALEHGGGGVGERLEDLSAAEAHIVADLPLLPRIH
jgi:tRNA-(ms[2]io[6]A)-hydroxylase